MYGYINIGVNINVLDWLDGEGGEGDKDFRAVMLWHSRVCVHDFQQLIPDWMFIFPFPSCVVL